MSFSIADVIGVIGHVSKNTSTRRKSDGAELKKRDILLVDEEYKINFDSLLTQ